MYRRRIRTSSNSSSRSSTRNKQLQRGLMISPVIYGLFINSLFPRYKIVRGGQGGVLAVETCI